jgi:hypothetical protein
MTDKSDKDQLIRQVYYDVDTGFGSIGDTYRDAKKILNTITYNDVKDFLERQKSRQTKPYRGFNSYVAHDPLQEIQIDIADFTRSVKDNDGFRYCFVAVDVFTKFCHAVPIKDKKPSESIRAMTEVINTIGVMKQIYHDNEGSWNSTEFIKLINKYNIKQIITSSPPPFAERMVQTLKNMIHTRLEGLELDEEKWVDMLQPVLKKYNNTQHSTIGMSPNDAKKNDNHIQVWLNIKNKAIFSRKYPPLKVGDNVRTYIKPHTFKKGYNPSWSKDIYTITYINKDNQYLVNDKVRKRVWSRHELLLVRGAEGKGDGQ